MSVLLNNNSGLVIQGTSSTSSKTVRVPYASTRGVYGGGKWNYSHNVSGTVTLGAPGTYKFSCNVGEWTVTLRNSGTTTVTVSKSVELTPYLTLQMQLTCQASDGAMTVTGTYTQVSTVESASYEQAGTLAIDVFEPAPIALNLPQQSWSPSVPSEYGAVGWYIDSVHKTLNFVDSIPLCIKYGQVGEAKTVFYFQDWLLEDGMIELADKRDENYITAYYDADYDEYVIDISLIAAQYVEFDIFVTPRLRTQAFIVNSKLAADSSKTSLYTYVPYRFEYFNDNPWQDANEGVGFDMIHHFNNTDLETQLLSTGTSPLTDANKTNMLTAPSIQSSRFFYYISSSYMFGGTNNMTWDTFTDKLNEMMLGHAPASDSTYFLQAIESNIVI